MKIQDITDNTTQIAKLVVAKDTVEDMLAKYEKRLRVELAKCRNKKQVLTDEIKTPEQLRINALKNKKDKAADALKAERDRQKQIKAREKIVKAQAALVAPAK